MSCGEVCVVVMMMSCRCMWLELRWGSALWLAGVRAWQICKSEISFINNYQLTDQLITNHIMFVWGVINFPYYPEDGHIASL